MLHMNDKYYFVISENKFTSRIPNLTEGISKFEDFINYFT